MNETLLARGGLPDAHAAIRTRASKHVRVHAPQVVALQSSLPGLEELHLAKNAIASLADASSSSAAEAGPSGSDAAQLASGATQPPPCAWQSGGFRCLQVLSLEDNALTSWGEVLRLARLPALIKLHLSGNPLPDLSLPLPSPAPPPQQQPPAPAASSSQQQPADSAATTTTTTTSGSGAGGASQPAVAASGQAGDGGAAVAGPGAGAFPALASLFLAGCALESWSSVDALSTLAALRDLRLTGNPVLGKSRTGGRFEVRAVRCGATHGLARGYQGWIANVCTACTTSWSVL